jgi:chemotaxis signal transduction protein
VSTRESQRLLLFELAGHVYGLPISGILEVFEASAPCGVPTLPAALAGVMNWHGEALPVVAPGVVVSDIDSESIDPIPPEPEPAPEPERGERVEAATKLAARMQQVLVIADRDSELPKLGLMIDAVLGLVDATGRVHPGAASSVVIERRSIDGRVVSVLDPRALVARARSAIEDMAA